MAEQVVGIEALLLDVAHPDLYRLNAFRITELPVDAEARDISRRQATIKQATDINVAIPAGYGRALPLEKGVDPDLLSQAVQHLGDPERRLIDEVFWFWPRQMGESREDEALLDLKRGEIDQVYNRWRQLREAPEDEGCALHNLAVLCHAQALDREHTASNKELSESEQQEQDKRWREAFSSWKMLLESEAFWSRVTARIRALDDPRLTTGMVRRMRMNLPQVLLLINARLAVDAAERNNVEDCWRHLDLMRSSGFEKQVIDDALHDAVEPIRERIKTLCKMVETQSLADPDKADGVARSLLDQSEPILKVLDRLLPEGDATHDGMHDEIARTALIAAIRYGNKTSNWSTFLPFVDRLQPLAVGELVRDQIKSERTSIHDYLEAQLCWYCRTRLAKKGVEHNVKIYGNIVRTYYFRRRRVQYQYLTIPVRRCNKCKKMHDKAEDFGTIGGWLGAASSIVSTIVIMSALVASVQPTQTYDAYSNTYTTTPGDTSGIIFFCIFGGLFLLWILIVLGKKIGVAIGTDVFVRPEKVRALRDVKGFPPIKHWISQGWQMNQPTP